VAVAELLNLLSRTSATDMICTCTW